MKSLRVIAAAVAALAWPAAGHAGMTKAQYNIEKGRIGAEFESARLKCDSYGGNARDICLAEARGNLQVAMAELQERRTPSSRTRYKLRIAKAEAEFDVASEECDERASAAKEACLAEVREALARDKADARRDRKPGSRRTGVSPAALRY